MRLHRFFIDQKITAEGVEHFSDVELVHQLKRVFRLHEGDKAILFDGSGNEHVCEIVLIGKDEVSFRVTETRAVKRHSQRKVALAVSLIKKDNFEWVIQKGTELGVSEFIPLVSDRSEKKGLNMERAKKIILEACEQSGRGDVPTIAEPQPLEEFLVHEKRKIVAFDIDGERLSREARSELVDVVACIGPEGGWSENDISRFKEKEASIATIDVPVLRAETAAIAVATLLLVE